MPKLDEAAGFGKAFIKGYNVGRKQERLQWVVGCIALVIAVVLLSILYY